MKIMCRIPSLLLPWCPKALPRCQNGPQGAKMEAPSPSNGNREDLKGAGGRGHSP